MKRKLPPPAHQPFLKDVCNLLAKRLIENYEKKLSRGTNQRAFDVVQKSTGETPPKPDKNPAAIELGRLGGLKGGPARAKKLSAKRRQQIAKIAAKARWKYQRRAKWPIT